jgi:hypothetical protein
LATNLTGTLKGVDTEDWVKFTATAPATIEYTVRHKGKGNNPLRVRLADLVIVVWGQMHDFEVQPGKSATRRVDFDWDMTPSTFDGKQDFRLRLSRDILTKEIPWEVNIKVTPPQWTSKTDRKAP